MGEVSLLHNPATYTCIVAFLAGFVSFLSFRTAGKALDFQKTLHARQTMILLANRCNDALKDGAFPHSDGGCSTIITTLCVAGDIASSDTSNPKDRADLLAFFWKLLHSSIWDEIKEERVLELISEGTIFTTSDIKSQLKEQYETARSLYI